MKNLIPGPQGLGIFSFFAKSVDREPGLRNNEEKLARGQVEENGTRSADPGLLFARIKE